MDNRYDPYREIWRDGMLPMLFCIWGSQIAAVVMLAVFDLYLFNWPRNSWTRAGEHSANSSVANGVIYTAFFLVLCHYAGRRQQKRIKGNWKYANNMGFEFFSKHWQFIPQKLEHASDKVIHEWLAVIDGIYSMAEKEEWLADLAKTKSERTSLRRDIGVLLPIIEKEKAEAIQKTNPEWINRFNKVIEYVTRTQAQLERNLNTDTITTTKETDPLSIFSGEYTITHAEQKAVAVTLRVDEQGEYEIYRRDGKTRSRLMCVVSGQQIRIDLTPPAESGRLEIVRKDDNEFDTISLP